MTSMGIDGKVLVGEEEQLQGSLTDQFPKCPAIQVPSRNLLQVKTGPVREVCVVYVKTGFKNKTKTPQNQEQRREEWVKEWETTEITEIREEGGESTPRDVQIFPAARGKLVLEQNSCWTEACRQPMPEQGKWQRSHYELTIMFLSSLCSLGWGWSSLEWRNRSILSVNKWS